MKQFLLLLFGMLVGYFLWSYAAKRDKSRLKRFGVRHATAVFLIVVACITALLTMFFSRAISIL